MGSPLGKTRTCPHCRGRILESASICPECHHFLRSDAVHPPEPPSVMYQPLKVEGSIQHPALSKPSEYSVILTVHDENGEELSRRVMAVGAIHPAETKKFTFWVEVYV
ncbi:MAG: hypothetical protein GTO40_00360 [Deltaproteobacteria bacterium]|nr:hypothetical protein [Deltaproteobacteria bacterium]